jgi:hypothetical protein
VTDDRLLDGISRRLHGALPGECTAAGRRRPLAQADGAEQLGESGLAALLVTIIVERLNALRSENRDASFLHWLLRADTRSADALLGSLRDLPVTEEHITVKGEDLEPYDAHAVCALFDEGSAVLSLTSLRHQIAAGLLRSASGRRARPHPREVRDDPRGARLPPASKALAAQPSPVDTQLYETQVRLIQKHFRLLERPASPRPSDLPVSA